jgi:hypothetical protein
MVLNDISGAADITVYSASDHDVTPPVATYPRLPARPPAGVRVEDFSTIELLVGETGRVESVKSLGRPHNLGEALACDFELERRQDLVLRPAAKDGRAVRYRTFVPGVADHPLMSAASPIVDA